MDINEPIISLRGVTKVFNTKESEVDALIDINLDIYQGEIYGIIGQSGAGKSTLVRCMNFLEKPTEGSVIFDGHNLADLSLKELLKVRQSIGMIFQQFNLLMQRTVLKNVCYPLEIAGVPKKEAKQRAVELLKMVGLSDKINAYPSQLSGGQKQRVAIARAIATRPKVLLCDEATSALDPMTTRSILELLKDINQRFGITIVIITHEMDVIESICDKVAILENGRIVEIGKVEDVFVNPKSEAGKRLVFKSDEQFSEFENEKIYRIVFNGQSSFEPIISNMVAKFKAPVNILFANTKNIGGKAFGHMLIQLPEDRILTKQMLHYLEERSVICEEVTQDV